MLIWLSRNVMGTVQAAVRMISMQLDTDSLPKTVDIILATYNGEKFLAQQIESLLAQTHVCWRLLVSDDGSSDATTKIIMRYSAVDARIVLVNTERQGGVVANFQKALEFASSDYLMFSDQDDVWLDNKIDIMLAEILRLEAEHGNTVPLLGFSDLKIVDSSLEILNESFYRSHKLDPNNNLDQRYLLWNSTVYGCTTIFNAALFRLAMPIPMGVPMHDQWFALIAASCGAVFYTPLQTILYRQHEENVVGARHKSFVERACAFRRTLAVIAGDIEKCKIQVWAARAIVIATSARAVANADLDNCRLNRFRSRWAFFRCNVLPFSQERTVYAVTFSVLFLFRQLR
jgi:glycosyltransferase involved in cell wall biosynthesis